MKVKYLQNMTLKDIKIVSLLVIFAAILRFINYPNRWGLAYDQSHFAILSKYALENNMLPLLGPFSSGGPFQTGGEWYWIVMLGELMYPFSILSPWIFVTLLSVIAIIPMYFIGVLIKDRILGVIIGILAVVSPVQVLQATNLTNQTPMILFSSFSILFMILFFKRKNKKYIFLQALMIGIASSIHIQAVALVPLLFFTLVACYKKAFQLIPLMILGVLIPWIPVFVSDLINNFYNTKSMLFYYLSDQAKVPYEVLGRRWLTFLSIFIPSSWARISGGFGIFGYIAILLVGVWVIFSFLQKKLGKIEWILLMSAGVMVIIVRYIRTPLFDNFLIFLHPFIFIFTGYAIYFIFTKKKILGFLILALFIFGSINASWKGIWSATNATSKEVQIFIDRMKEMYPNEEFAVYDMEMKTNGKSFPLVYFLYFNKMLDQDGVKVGLSIATNETVFQNEHSSFYGKLGDYQLYDLSSSSSSQLEEAGWAKVDPEKIYNSVQKWYVAR